MREDDQHKRGRTFFDFVFELLEKSRYWIILAGFLLFFGVWFIAHWSTEPGGQVSVWGLVEYTKKKDTTSSIPIVKSGSTNATPTPIKPQIAPTAIQRPSTPTPIPVPKYEMAVLVVDESYKIHATITQEMRSITRNMGKNTTILPSTILDSSQTFERIFAGDGGDASKVELLSYSQYVILGKQVVSFTQNANLEDLITADVSLEVHVIASRTGSIQTSFTIRHKGVGFSRKNAEEKGIKELLQELDVKLVNAINQL
jgi:hypothetical protein